MSLIIGKLRKSKAVEEYSTDYKEYEFSRKETIANFEKKTVVEITANDIETVIVNSFEGGSNYWLGLDTETEGNVWNNKPNGVPYSTWGAQMLLEGKTLHFYDVEEEEEHWTLNLEQLINGFKLNAEKRPFDCDLENGDVTTSDCILQYGIFMELVYG